MNNEIKQALEHALDIEYEWVDNWNETQYTYRFSNKFIKKMEKTFKIATKQYISVGHFRMTRIAIAALLITMLMILAGCGFIVRQAVIYWDEIINTDQKTIDIIFDIEDPDHTLIDDGFVIPKFPDGYSIAIEEKSESSYYIEAVNNKYYIAYQQEKGIENIGLSIDAESNNLKKIEISGNKGYASSKHGVQSITWSDGIYLYDIYGNCTLTQLKQIAESIAEQ